MAISSDDRTTLVLIDGNAMVHRAFHALPEDLSTKTGELVNATMGFTSMLLKILIDEKPEDIAVAFDRPAPTFRHLDYSPYKAQRPAMPDHLRPQFGRIREVVRAFNIPIYEMDGFEGDDVLGTLARQATEMGLHTIIVTGDMDTMQLVGPQVEVLAAKKGIGDITRYDVEAVKTRYGVGPERIPDWKALTGDTSDNIPGVPGIGDKTATKLLQAYDSLEGILEHTAELPARQRQLLTEHADQARKSKWLATIVTDVPVTLDLATTKTHEFDRAAVRELFRELEFHSLIDRLGRVPHGVEDGMGEEDGNMKATKSHERREGDGSTEGNHGGHGHEGATRTHGATATLVAPAEPQEEAQLALFALEPLPPEEGSAPVKVAGQGDTQTSIVNDERTLEVLAASLRRAGRFAFDTETDATDPMLARLVGISLAMGAAEAYYIPVGHVTTAAGEEPGRQLDLATIQRILGPVLYDAGIGKIGHNAKYDALVLGRHGMAVEGITFDTMVAAYLADPGRRGLGLKEQAFEILGIVMTPINELIGVGQKQITMDRVPVRRAADYAGADADMTWRLIEPLERQMHQLAVWDLFTNVEMPLLPVLARMERTGILVDPTVLARMAVELGEQLITLEAAIYEAVGHQFNIQFHQAAR